MPRRKKFDDDDCTDVLVVDRETGREVTGTLCRTKRGTFFHADDPISMLKSRSQHTEDDE